MGKVTKVREAILAAPRGNRYIMPDHSALKRIAAGEVRTRYLMEKIRADLLAEMERFEADTAKQASQAKGRTIPLLRRAAQKLREWNPLARLRGIGQRAT